MSEIMGYKDHTREESCDMHPATQTGVEAAIAKNEVEHLNAKRIQDQVEDVKHELREDEEMMMFPGNCGGFGGGGMATGLLFGLLASGGCGWGGRGHGGCGDGGRGHHDTIEILRDNHDGILNLKDEASRNALAAADARRQDALLFQKELDCNKLTTVEAMCKLQKEIECGFREVDKQFCCLKEGMLKNELEERNEKIEDLKAQLRQQELLAAISAKAA